MARVSRYRRRKIKCDELRPACKHCQTAKIICDGYGSTRPIKSVGTASSTSISISPPHHQPLPDSPGNSWPLLSAASSIDVSVMPTAEKLPFTPPCQESTACQFQQSLSPSTFPSAPPENSVSAFPVLNLPGMATPVSPITLDTSGNPIGFDSLFGLGKSLSDGDETGAPYPNNHYDDQDFVNFMLQNLAGAQPSLFEESLVFNPSGRVSLPAPPPMSMPPLPSDKSNPIRPMTDNPQTFAAQPDARSQGPSSSSSRQETLVMNFAPQPAIDPILRASSQVYLHKLRTGRRENRVPTLEELDLGPPPTTLPGLLREWSVPPKILEEMKSMDNERHIELLNHCRR